jgi:hypothetical protein
MVPRQLRRRRRRLWRLKAWEAKRTCFLPYIRASCARARGAKKKKTERPRAHVHAQSPSKKPRGRQKKIDGPGPPRTLTKSQTHPPTIRIFFLVRFWAFLGKGSSKTPQKYFYKKSMSKTFPKISTKNFDVSFSSTFFVLSRFRAFLSDGSSKTLQKTFYKKNRVEKFLQKIRPKIQNRLFLDFFFITFLGVSR